MTDHFDYTESDPVLEKFLDFLAKDIEKNPDRLQPITYEWLERCYSLVKDVEVDLYAPLPDEDE